jgi:predicted acetyltransferase
MDDVIELRLIRVMDLHTASSRPANEQFLAHVPECRFAIHRLEDGNRVGRIHIRVTNDENFIRLVGHIGYAVDEKHRRNGFATRAIRLIRGLARYWDVAPLWVLIEPQNVPSLRAAEHAGFTLVDQVDASMELLGLGVGRKVCRYKTLD